MKKRLFSTALALFLVMGLCNSAAFGEEPSVRLFTDSLGREVEVPARIEKVAVSGPLTQISIFPLCPEKLAGISSKWDDSAAGFLAEEYLKLPVLGQLYGGKGELNLETLLNSGAEIVIDVGEPKGSAADDLNALQEQTGLPFVHITATTETMGNAYRMLGDLLGMEQQANVLADYCDSNLAMLKDLASRVEKKDLLYLVGTTGMGVIGRGAYHAEAIDLIGNNIAVLEKPSSKGTGNEVDMEQLLLWNPDYLFFSPDSLFDSIGEDEIWGQLKAIQDGHFYRVPFGPYNWMGFPPSVQRYLGMYWMASILYPDDIDFNLQDKVTEYFRLFYHTELSDEMYHELVGDSVR